MKTGDYDKIQRLLQLYYARTLYNVTFTGRSSESLIDELIQGKENSSVNYTSQQISVDVRFRCATCKAKKHVQF